MNFNLESWHGTTIIGVLKNGSVSIAGDGQVTLGQTVIKGTAKKVQKLKPGGLEIVVGFAGSTADAGFRNLLFRDIPVFADDHCPAGMMFFINENFIQFRHHRKRNFTFEPFQKPINQDARVAKVLWLGALTCSAPRYHGIVSGLPTAY